MMFPFDRFRETPHINWISPSLQQRRLPPITYQGMIFDHEEVRMERVKEEPNVVCAQLLEDFIPTSTPVQTQIREEKRRPETLQLITEPSEDPETDRKKRKLDAEEKRFVVYDAPIPASQRKKMEPFSVLEGNTWKHTLYNLLVQNHNDPEGDTFISPCRVSHRGVSCDGFRFDIRKQPKKRLAELYSAHVK
eukprot:TRINITY_DN10681_c0_g1_i1.p1 TRINITY_DN10681_c0_g1~~TRINITY_DN10681_c0_g1_i1.p1  ORF type:complete len:192 (-),score=26.25 TRINITY_DN10681_c0_g1_i1:285-860(-)